MSLFADINYFLNRHLPPASKKILVINVGVFLFLFLLHVFSPDRADYLVGMIGEQPRAALGRLHVWQFVTYMFTHVELDHLLFNMMVFWWVGPGLERRMGRRSFWSFYMVAGIGAGVLQALLALAFGRYHGQYTQIIGASGAIMGAMLAYAAYFPEQIVYLYMLFPVKVKYLMAGTIALELIYSWLNSRGLANDGISHITHVTGALVAYVWLTIHHRDWDIRNWRGSY